MVIPRYVADVHHCQPVPACYGALPHIDRLALFADRARASAVDLSVEEQAGSLAVSVCLRLEGMPLAIELAAARLRSMSLAELHGRLDQRFRLLTGGSRTSRRPSSCSCPRSGGRTPAPTPPCSPRPWSRCARCFLY